MSGSNKKTSIILDTGALLAKYYRLLPRHQVYVYTCNSNVKEVLDSENRLALEEAINLGIINVVEPERKYVEKAIAYAKKTGCLAKLSKADIDVLALALQMSSRGCGVIVITDDYDLQSMLYTLRIGFKPLRVRGIREVRFFKSYCPVCGYVPSQPAENTCPLCNSRIIHVQV